MSDSETIESTETVVITAGKPGKKSKKKAAEKTGGKAKAKAKTARSRADKPARPDHGFDFVGKVESLVVKSGAGPEGFTFCLKGRHGKRMSFRFDSADGFAMNAMAHLVLAAHAGGTRLGVRSGAEADGVFIVRELESRPKLGKD
ncbi:hypothetical protein DK847_03860 [Aestuariivirga litoralis]|uniref:Uncharacterized protein n=1 Tax=Aestuariivirga litoralis TaxID=2650924 RepID=A0A2W2BRV8_9HYPH|nr:hypothetical protein [Aestuariivirga litoralis]PZF78929.1 hypothetical protein DK847_03860 [Aestuariivirga litoralis]